jgi:hypothetical protein
MVLFVDVFYQSQQGSLYQFFINFFQLYLIRFYWVHGSFFDESSI